jgi:hypothetical protein
MTVARTQEAALRVFPRFDSTTLAQAAGLDMLP